MPIPVAKRVGTVSHIRPLKDGIRFLLIIFKIATLYSPLEAVCPTSALFFMLGVGYYVYTFVTEHRFTNMSMLLFSARSHRVSYRTRLRADHGTDLPAGPMTVDTDTEFTDKYERTGGIGAWLVDRFYDAVRDLLQPALRPGDTMMEIGCGAGYSTERLRAWLPEGIACAGSDVGASLVDKARRRNPGTPIIQQSVYSLAMPTKSVDVLVMMEVLEHLEQPAAALAELARVARRHVLISTPREPVWRALNMARGKYLGALGNTPGHVQHWSSAGLRRAVSPTFEVQAMRCPLPWTILLLTPRL